MIAIMPAPIDMLFRDANRRSYKRGETVFRSGDPVTSVYLVLDGAVELVRHSASGTRLVLHRAIMGDILAEASVYSEIYHCDGEVAAMTRLASLPASSFLQRLDTNPVCARNWAAKLAHSLQSARMQSEMRGLKTVAEKLDMWLSNGRAIPPKGQVQELAQDLGVTREALYRELAKRR